LIVGVEQDSLAIKYDKRIAINKMTDKQVFELKIYNTINGMDEEVRSKFKALALISDDLAKISEDHDEETRKVEIEFEKKFKPIYDLRSKIIQGEQVDIEASEYDTRLG